MNIFLNSPVMWVLCFISIIALAIIIERFFVLQQVQTGGEAFVKKIIDMLGQFPSKERIEAARQYCIQERSQNLSAKVLAIILNQSKYDSTFLEKLIEAERNKILPFLEKRLTTLATISSIAPLLGLLGTVIGMIKSFVVISQGNLESSSLAGGISEALLTTALGLIIAIPCIVCYNYFLRKVENFIHDIEVTSGEVIRHIKH
ncbi:biopolymer transport protein ExbB [Spirochaetota bacterium]|nr:biopolymer transport protein ExbB [Spirochaetota bacterium]